ncbi:MAG: hypothetical protein WCL42_02740 [Chlorobiaceae bacterium]|jgi:hypothetical protein
MNKATNPGVTGGFHNVLSDGENELKSPPPTNGNTCQQQVQGKQKVVCVRYTHCYHHNNQQMD